MGLSHLSQITELTLYGSRYVTDSTLTHLKGSSRLKELTLLGTQVTDNGIANLKESLPKVEITRRAGGKGF